MEMGTTDLIARARAGDHNAFRDLVQGHSHELQVHCHRILGSLQDAEGAPVDIPTRRSVFSCVVDRRGWIALSPPDRHKSPPSRLS